MTASDVLPVHVLVLAKEPVPGRVKTRLHPPLSPAQCAAVAGAALADTLAAVLAAPVARRTLVLDGRPCFAVPAGVQVVPQRDGAFGARLEGAFADAAATDPAGLPLLLVGMDTPQLDADLLGRAAALLLRTGCVLGPATDGGWWALGLSAPLPGAFDGVPMSVAETGARQLDRLRALGLEPAPLPALRDIDTVADLHAVRALLPAGSALGSLDLPDLEAAA